MQQQQAAAAAGSSSRQQQQAAAVSGQPLFSPLKEPCYCNLAQPHSSQRAHPLFPNVPPRLYLSTMADTDKLQAFVRALHPPTHILSISTCALTIPQVHGLEEWFYRSARLQGGRRVAECIVTAHIEQAHPDAAAAQATTWRPRSRLSARSTLLHSKCELRW